MPIVPVQSSLIAEDSGVWLARYAAILGLNECAFWGVRPPGVSLPACRSIWTKPNRDMVARYLAEAQAEAEAVIAYPLSRRWFADEPHPYTCPLQAVWGEVVSGGVRATAAIAADAAVNHATDPAIIGPIATTVTDQDEIHVYYPASLIEEAVEIVPSDIDLVGGQVTIYIPRCRMVHPTVADNPDTGLSYTVMANFLATVDVVRVYNDPSTHAELVWPHHCNCSGTCPTCGEYTRDGCIYVRSPRLGILDVLPATYSGGAWSATGAACCAGRPERVRLNYLAGKLAVSRQEEDMIVRLAHAKMPEEPCGCDDLRRLWKRDRNTPETLTRERINCPFGMSDGAWMAWRFAQSLRLMRGGTL